VEPRPYQQLGFNDNSGRTASPAPPATIGDEGVGRVVARDSRSKEFEEGDPQRLIHTSRSRPGTERVKFTASWQRPWQDMQMYGNFHDLRQSGETPDAA